jgi:hypothetical protein
VSYYLGSASSPIERLNPVTFIVTRTCGDPRRMLCPQAVEFELCRTLSRVVRFPEKRPIAEIDDGQLQLSSRDDKTPLELFIAGVKALTLRPSIVGIALALRIPAP